MRNARTVAPTRGNIHGDPTVAERASRPPKAARRALRAARSLLLASRRYDGNRRRPRAVVAGEAGHRRRRLERRRTPADPHRSVPPFSAALRLPGAVARRARPHRLLYTQSAVQLARLARPLRAAPHVASATRDR